MQLKDSILRQSSIPNRVIKDPVRYPKIQTKVEDQMKNNYTSSLKVMLLEITKTLNK